MKHWINTVSREHVLRGMEGGFTQAGHGRATGLARLTKGDLLVFYSPRMEMDGGEPLQAFTALGRILDDEPYQVAISPDVRHWRRRMEFVKSEEAPIRELIDDLDFISNKKSWGFVFRRGLFEIGAEDFRRIARAMKAAL